MLSFLLETCSVFAFAFIDSGTSLRIHYRCFNGTIWLPSQ